MNTVHQGLNGATRRMVGLFATLTVAAVVAGGAGGYLIHGASTLVVTQATPASQTPAHAVTGPLTEPHDATPQTGSAVTKGVGRDSQSGYGATSPANAGSPGLNADSGAGY